VNTATITRPRPDESVAYYHRYIDRVTDDDLSGQLTGQLRDVEKLFESVTDRAALSRYAEGKWSIKEILGHLSDVERIFSYRRSPASMRTPTRRPADSTSGRCRCCWRSGALSGRAPLR
jgi:DinB superfamily